MQQVISASRRTDIPMRYLPWLIEVLEQGYVDVPQPYNGRIRRVLLRPEDVHTLVLWSKDLWPLLHDVKGTRRMLTRYEQLFCHLTITGLGGSMLEPHILPWREVVTQLPELVQFTGDARRVSVRFDPIVHWYDGDETRSNVPFAEAILSHVSQAGITAVRISFATLYGKLRRRGVRWCDPSPAQRLEITGHLVELARRLGLTLYACSQSDLVAAGAVTSCCIDGELLSALHPRGLRAATGKDAGQRPACGCTPSVDIGSYAMRCPNACRYCYANPEGGSA